MSRWLSWSRRPQRDEQLHASLAELANEFLDLDNRQAIAEAAVEAAGAIRPHLNLEREWAPIRQACYDASAVYLDASSSGAADQGRATAQTVQRAKDMLTAARRGLDDFYDRHRADLDSAAATVRGAASAADAVVLTAHRARQRLASADPQSVAYPSVQRASARLDAAVSRLQAARERGDLKATLEGTSEVSSAADAVIAALDAAPQREQQAQRTISSVRTRLDALRHRATGIAPNVSALLREFNAKSSADLVNNEKNGGVHLDRAAELIANAVAAAREQRPEDALDIAAQARTELGAAEELFDAVGDRLDTLRKTRADPTAAVESVKFRLRDAQRLAVDRGVVAEWGSVLDAQVARIERIVSQLTGAHPDYWAYHQALDDVSVFIAGVVDRIRRGAAR